MKRVRLALGVLMLLAALAAIGLAGRTIEHRLVLGPGPLAQPAVLVIERGASAPAIGRQLEAAGVIAHWWLYPLAIQAFDRGGAVHAGEYAFAPGESLHDALILMREGRTVVHHLTAPEGLTVAEIVAVIDAEPALSGLAGPLPAEGSLMPDTYNFSLAESRSGMIARMRRAMERTLGDLWANRAPGLALATPQAALTLASIVEKETAIPEERPKVAAVFLNRLRVGMKLQADPTVIYALTGGKASLGRPLGHADLAIDSPFNSYRVEGLPPTPIACPGRSALAAALHPADTRALYFVADGTGRHAFAESLDDHNRNVAKLRASEQAGGAN